LQKKFEEFETSDNNRLNEIWQMNHDEALNIVGKIMLADKVIHTQQLDVPWVPPSDPIFKNNLQKLALQTGNDGSVQAESVQEAAKGLAESNAKSNNELDGGVEGASEAGKDMSANRIKYEKIKNVFKMLIEEAEYLIDDRTLEKCRSLPAKQQFSLKIDSIRKSLGIENMEDVQLLVDTLYEFEPKYQREQKAAWDKQIEELEKQAADSGLPLQPLPSKPLADDLEESA